MCSRVLDLTTLQLFESNYTSRSDISSFDQLLDFVQQKCRILENIKNSSKPDSNERFNNARGKTPVFKKSVFSALHLLPQNQNLEGVYFVTKLNTPYINVRNSVTTIEKRREFVLSPKLCFACMSSAHMVNACVSIKGCRSCNSKRHHSMLHQNQDRTSTTGKSYQKADTVSKPGPSTDISSSFAGAARTSSTVLLGIAIIHVRDAWNKVHAVRVLLDSGSQILAMTSNCFARLGLPKHRFNSEIVGLAQSPLSHVEGITNCTFSPYFKSDYSFPPVDLVILSQITTTMPSMRLPQTVRQRYQHLRLADNDFDIPSCVDVLFGADILPCFIRPNAGNHHHPGLPSALDTKLGWIVFGSFSTSSTSPLVTLTSAVDSSVDELLQSFWAVEEPSAPVSPTTEDQWCEEHFKKSMSRDSSGRFCVALPFRDLFVHTVDYQASSSHNLGDYRSIALKRFYNLEKRLAKDNRALHRLSEVHVNIPNTWSHGAGSSAWKIFHSTSCCT